MLSFKEIEDIPNKKERKAKKNNVDKTYLKKRIAILGGFTTGEITEYLDYFLLDKKIDALFWQSEYNQYEQDILFTNSELTTFAPDVIIVMINNSNLPEKSFFTEQDFEQEKLKIERLLVSITKNYKAQVIINNFDIPFYRPYGSIDGIINGKTWFVNKINGFLSEKASEFPSVHIFDLHYLSSLMGLNAWYDFARYNAFRIPFSLDASLLYAFHLAQKINITFGGTKKCLVLDLDNTLWGGVIGDDGLEGIQIGLDNALAKTYYDFQAYVKALKERGVILAICSKNDYENALLGLTHESSLLSKEDFVVIKANWQPKHENIKAIATEINIGLDSLVFIDDSPMERDIIKQYLPMVCVPEINSEEDLINAIDKNLFFDVNTITENDKERTGQYKKLIEGKDTESQFESYNDYLASLKMKAVINEFNTVNLSRIVQLINKTNQFNLTTKRYTESDITEITDAPFSLGLTGVLKDKFVDHGLIAILIAHFNGEVAHLDTFLMSCRVLKREFEYYFFSHFVALCKLKSIKKISATYIRTAKNNMVTLLLDEFGFTLEKEEENTKYYTLNIINYKFKNYSITEE